MVGFLDTDVESDEFWGRVREKLNARDLRLIFAADRIPSELRTIVEFLNEQMSTVEVLAVEVRKYTSDELHMVSSELVGDTARAAQRRGARPTGPIWTEGTFFEAARGWGNDGDEAAGLQADLLAWVKEHGCPVYAGRSPLGGLHLRVPFCPPQDRAELVCKWARRFFPPKRRSCSRARDRRCQRRSRFHPRAPVFVCQ